MRERAARRRGVGRGGEVGGELDVGVVENIEEGGVFEGVAVHGSGGGGSTTEPGGEREPRDADWVPLLQRNRIGDRAASVGSGRLEPGTLIDDEFIVGSTLRVGGAGAVYRAVRRSTGERCAVRVLSSSLGDVATRERLVELARVGPSIESAHVPAMSCPFFR